MPIEKKTLPNGEWEVTATGREVNELRGQFREINGAEVAKRRKHERDHPSRKMRNKSGGIVEINGDRVEKLCRKGFTVVDTPPASVMPDNVLGFTKTGQLVYAHKPKRWPSIRAYSRDGAKGWALA